MDRRFFLKAGLATATVTGAGVVGARAAGAAVQSAKRGSRPKVMAATVETAEGAATESTKRNLRTNIAVSPSWFKGSHVEVVEQVAAAGFPAFEQLGCGSWQDKEQVRERSKELNVLCGAVGGGMGTINNWGPNDPEYHERFVAAVKEGIANAKAIGSKRVLALSGAARKGVEKERQMDALAKAGQLVAPMLDDAGIVLVWECLNVLVNHPGYFLVYSADGADLIRRTDRPSVKFLFDIYHQQISEGNLIRNIQAYKNEIGHFHFADNPGRHEPGTGEINYKNVFKAIYETGYRDIVASEFSKSKPPKSTPEILDILAECDQW